MALRDMQIDITKGIAIVLMIIGHCSLSSGTIRYLLFSFHMPLFFIYSGCLFGQDHLVPECVINNELG